MKKIWEVYKRDLGKLSHNLFAMIIVIGIVIIPALYAWFNIHSNWDPYSNTQGIRIAVANNDDGASLEGLNVNVGGMIVDKLTENKQIGWQFVNETEALDGVKSAEYYAAIIIPKTFSKDMLSITELELKKPQIDYYVNEKKNAIAPKITNAGVNAVQLQVNETFIETASSVLSTLLQDVDAELDSKESETVTKVTAALNEARDSLEDYETLLSMIISSTGQLDSALASAGNLIPDTGAVSSEIDSARTDVADGFATADNTFQALSSSLGASLDHYGTELDNARQQLDQLASADSGSADRLASTAIGKLETLQSLNSSILSALQNLQNALPQPVSSLDTIIAHVQENGQTLTDASATLETIRQTAQAGKEIPKDLLDKASQSLQKVTSVHESIVDAYDGTLMADLNGLQDQINAKLDMASGLVQGANSLQGSVSGALSSTRNSISSANDTLTKSRDLLVKAGKKLDGYLKEIESVSGDERLEKLSQLLARDPALISGFLKEPVSLSTHSIYPIRNYGSGMAPFYTVLAIWVGALVNVAIVKTKVKDPEEFGGLTPAQAYFGRYLLFATISVAQALVISLGDLYMLGIQCVEPGLFVLMAVCTALTYSLLMYTLTVSFGDVGKALAVILMVVQVAGSGGTFPIETLPQLYQDLYPFFPFNFSINGMRECVAGIYGNHYWMDLLRLSGWVLVSLFIGLGLRKPLIRVKDYIEEKIEETGIIG